MTQFLWIGCAICQRKHEYSGEQEEELWQAARAGGWRITLVPLEDTSTGRLKQRRITICPNCIRDGASNEDVLGPG